MSTIEDAAAYYDRTAGQPARFPHDEVDRAMRRYIEVAATGDWDAWFSNLFTEDCLYVCHLTGTHHGREGVREWIVPLMRPIHDMGFPAQWYMISGDWAVFYSWNRFPNPDGTDGPPWQFQWPCICILHYAGDGLWAYEEDIQSPLQAEDVIGRYLQVTGRAPGS